MAAPAPQGGPRLRHRILALAMLFGQALQLELPVAHAPAHFGSGDSELVLAKSAPPQQLLPTSTKHGRAHDASSCPICQSLHAKPAVTPPAAPERALPELAALLVAPAQRPHDCVARSGHPPRAPPQTSLSLA
jgi:DUF2946 family protein